MNKALTPLCLIEDDALLGETLSDGFRMEGLPFDWHRTGESALLAFQRRKYSAVLCDLRLPDTSGKAIFESLDYDHRPPFIFMTGFGTIDEAVSLLKSGAEDFVTKPFDLDALMQRLLLWILDRATRLRDRANTAYRVLSRSFRSCLLTWRISFGMLMLYRALEAGMAVRRTL